MSQPIKNAAESAKPEEKKGGILNSLSGLVSYLSPFSNTSGQTSQVSQSDTMQWNLRGYLISNNRFLLSQSYVEHGIIQTLIDQPVEDGFRGGVEIKTHQLDEEQIAQLQTYCERNNILDTIVDGVKWARLFGGSAILIVTEQDPATPLDFSRIKEKTRIDFRAIDQWELTMTKNPANDANIPRILPDEDYYYFYGIKVHKSRILKIMGKAAPSYVRPRLRGWGMSEVERLVRSLNQYLKNQDVVFELLDEAKIDIYKISGFNSALMSNTGTQKVAERIQGANQLKNYTNALTMDANDDYEQKTMTFAGLAEMLTQIRIGIASDVKMPLTKLFGLSASGFNSGEDDIENYNSMVESSVRSRSKYVVSDVVSVISMKLFGFVPDDLQIGFHPLRELSSEQEQNVKNSQFNRAMNAYQSGVADIAETKESINKNELLPTSLDVKSEALKPIDIKEDFSVPTEKGA